jgi:hypothetical protein
MNAKNGTSIKKVKQNKWTISFAPLFLKVDFLKG